MAVVGKLEVLTMVNTAGLESGFAKSTKAMKGFGDKARGAGGAMGWISKGKMSLDGIGKSFFSASLFANLAASAIQTVGNALMRAGRAAVRFISDQMSAIDATNKLATSLGFTSKEFVGLQHGAELSGMGVSEFENSMMKMQDTLGEALMGTKSAQDAFEGLRLNIKDMADMTSQQRIYAIADAVKTLGFSAQTSAALANIFGRRVGPDLMRFLGEGSAGLNVFTADAEQLGITFSEVAGVQVEMANDALNRLWKIFIGVARTIAIEISPYLTIFGNKLVELATKTDILNRISKAVWSYMQKGIDVAVTSINGLITAANAVYLVFKGLQLVLYKALTKIAEGFAKVAALEKKLPTKLQTGLSVFADALVDELKRTTTKIEKDFTGPDLFRKIETNWEGQLTNLWDGVKNWFSEKREEFDAEAERRAKEREALLAAGAAIRPTEAKEIKTKDVTPAALLRGTAEEYSAIYKARRAMQGADPALKVQQDQLAVAKRQEKQLDDIARSARGGFQLAAAGIA